MDYVNALVHLSLSLLHNNSSCSTHSWLWSKLLNVLHLLTILIASYCNTLIVYHISKVFSQYWGLVKPCLFLRDVIFHSYLGYSRQTELAVGAWRDTERYRTFPCTCKKIIYVFLLFFKWLYPFTVRYDVLFQLTLRDNVESSAVFFFFFNQEFKFLKTLSVNIFPVEQLFPDRLIAEIHYKLLNCIDCKKIFIYHFKIFFKTGMVLLGITSLYAKPVCHISLCSGHIW